METEDLDNAVKSATKEAGLEPKQETGPPGKIAGELESIDRVKGRLFSSVQTGGGVNVQDSVILYNRREDSLQENNPDENAREENAETVTRNVNMNPTVDCESSPNLENTALDNNHYPVADNAPHDQTVLSNAACLERTLSVESSSSLASDLLECDTCKLLRGRFSSRESVDFWDKVDRCGNDRNCNSKFWINFIAKLEEEFPQENGLQSKQTRSLLKTLLGVKNRDDAEVGLTDLLSVVRFFGPVKPDPSGRCLLIQHLQEIIKRSVLKGKQYQRVSWFAGEMSRDEANEILHSQSDNTYLVRMSQSNAERGSFVVSVKNKNGCHHFEIEGNPLESAKSPTINCHLRLMGKSYQTLPAAIEDLKFNSLHDEDNNEDIWCTRICPDLRFNSIITPYKVTK
ncbi:uncharacterized protein LOC133184965 [Saccostrea echinata]|uniref:uncharacterized protein LOC133184965 n=1 Tax=Saccostrea echinata TaxID=191078 RepID=UPI002A836B4F|nr:uncharacterized protein LOC133184965 [Saccostrea echinata]